MRSRKLDLDQIVELHIDPGMQGHPALTKSSASASHCDRRKPAAWKDADTQLLRIPLPASGIRAGRGHLSNPK
jgi:hypothetical protein